MQLNIQSCHLNIYSDESSISFSVKQFPFDQHQQWFDVFCASFEFKKGDFEYSADLSLGCIYFKNSVFILHINELLESIWLSATIKSENAQNQLNSILEHIQHKLIE